MNTTQLKKLISTQRVAEFLAISTISSFFLSSLYAEIIQDNKVILQVKTFIVYAIPLMLIFMPTIGITGNKIAKLVDSLIVKRKNKRVKLMALNGIILLTLAFVLYFRAKNGKIDSTFLTLQIIEFCFGFTNISMLFLMLKDGYKLKKSIL